MDKKRVIFLCTHNSARSQMAEGMLNHLRGDRYQAFSAGTEPEVVHPLAIRVMTEIGIDISGYRSKHVREFIGQPVDIVITVCDHAREACPIFPGAREVRHESFTDPSAVTGCDEEKLASFRSVRDAIHVWLDKELA